MNENEKLFFDLALSYQREYLRTNGTPVEDMYYQSGYVHLLIKGERRKYDMKEFGRMLSTLMSRRSHDDREIRSYESIPLPLVQRLMELAFLQGVANDYQVPKNAVERILKEQL